MRSLAVVCLFVFAASCCDAYTWCCTSSAEYKKCKAFGRRVNEDGSRVFDFDCTLADDVHNCMDKIKVGEADIIDLDGGDIYDFRNDISVVAAENVGYEDASYYAVAVVKKGHEFPGLSMKKVSGYKTCHTGVGKSSGWNVPMGWLLRHNGNPSEVAASCAPGANITKYQYMLPGGVDPKWCSLCKGDQSGNNKCARNSNEKYYGYHGAFQCMKDGVGDVAFIKQTIISAEEAPQFELLCPDAPRRASPLEWQTCNLGRVPAHAVVMRKGVSAADAESVYAKLASAWNKLGDRNSYGGGKNILWGSKVRYFMYMDRMEARKYMGDEYFCSVYAVKNQDKPNHYSCIL